VPPMPPRHPFDVESEMQRHGDALRALAGALVRDPNAADDALQEVWLATMLRPPQHTQALGGWLATALHNVARMWRRGEQRRTRREAEVAARRAPWQDDAPATTAREALGRRLLDAVEALEPPFRDTIWQRFFAGMAPRDIAAAHGVPVATVKSRLQRGLGMLRARLGEREGTDWRGGLAAAFGLRETAAVAPGIGAMASGGVLMATWLKGTGAITAVAAVAFWCWPDGEPPAAAALARDAAPAVAPVAAQLAATAGTPSPAANGAGAPRTAVEAARIAPDPRFAIVRGRCVDEQGTPLADCEVELHGWEANRDRTAAWLADHLKIEWTDPPLQTTGADGTFGFAFAPLPPLQFAVWITRPRMIRMEGRWSTLAERQLVDVGDVTMQAGIVPHGRVVDTNGAPCEGVALDFNRAEAPGPRHGEPRVMEPRAFGSARSDATGAFTGRWAMPPGTYRLHVSSAHGWQLQGPPSIELVAGHTAPLEVVVTPAKGTIQGRVVDGHDRPVAGASIEAMVTGATRIVATRSSQDGSFVLASPRNDAPSTQLMATADGHESIWTERPIDWGSRDVVLRFTQATMPFTVRVTDEHGAPVEMFSVHATALGDTRRGKERTVRAHGPHGDGTATLADVGVGAHVLCVEFPAATGRTPLLRRVDLPALQRRVALRSSLAQRVVRVVYDDGAPVAGTRVQRCLLPGQALDEDTPLVARERWHDNYHGALVLDDVTTDGDGRCTITGTGGQAFGLRVLGPGHAPALVPTMTMETAEELVVTVARGGTLRGRIVPDMAAAELARLATSVHSVSRSEWHTHVLLKQGTRSFPVERARMVFPDEPAAMSARIAADGSFALAHVPAGEWNVEVHFHRALEGVRAVTTERAVGPRVQVTEGEVTTVEVDLSAIVPGRLLGTVLHNGTPVANAQLMMEGPTTGAIPHPRTDAHGRFEYSGPPCAIRVRVTDLDGKVLPVALHASNPATMLRQTTVEHTFVIASGTLEVLVLDPAGKPAPEVQLSIADPAATLPRASADGRIRCELTAGTFVLRTLPPSLQSADAQRRETLAAMRDRRPGDWRDTHWLEVGVVTVIAGQTTSTEVQLPPAFAK
jgi:RNA polymerase sigma factor (sigma-70 family)